MNNIEIRKEQFERNRNSQYIGLIGTVIREGIEEEGLRYLESAGGKMWCTLTGVNPENLRRVIMKKFSRKFDPNALV
jgi:hypothetical protein